MKLLIHFPLLAFCISMITPSVQKTDSCKAEKIKTKKMLPKKDSADVTENSYPLFFSIITNKF